MAIFTSKKWENPTNSTPTPASEVIVKPCIQYILLFKGCEMIQLWSLAFTCAQGYLPVALITGYNNYWQKLFASLHQHFWLGWGKKQNDLFTGRSLVQRVVVVSLCLIIIKPFYYFPSSSFFIPIVLCCHWRSILINLLSVFFNVFLQNVFCFADVLTYRNGSSQSIFLYFIRGIKSFNLTML